MAPADTKTKPLALILHAVTVVIGLWYAVEVSLAGAIVALAVALSAGTVLCYISRPFTLALSSKLNIGIALALVLPGLGAAFFYGMADGIVLAAGSALIIRLVQAWYYHRPGGLTDASLSVTGLLVECFTLFYIQKGSFPSGQ